MKIPKRDANKHFTNWQLPSNQINNKQESIPVGCVPPSCWLYSMYLGGKWVWSTPTVVGRPGESAQSLLEAYPWCTPRGGKPPEENLLDADPTDADHLDAVDAVPLDTDPPRCRPPWRQIPPCIQTARSCYLWCMLGSQPPPVKTSPCSKQATQSSLPIELVFQ